MDMRELIIYIYTTQTNVWLLCILAHMQDVTLGDLLLNLHTCGMLLAHMQDVTLGDLILHLHTCGMLR